MLYLLLLISSIIGKLLIIYERKVYFFKRQRIDPPQILELIRVIFV
jgi:hypothetical protein